jgi:hypothetical protein
MKWKVQFTSRRRDPETGDPYRWNHGSWGTEEEAEEHAARVRPGFAPDVRVEAVPARRAPSTLRAQLHAKRTRAGMARARRAGKRIGRPRARFDVQRARGIVAAKATVVGKWNAVEWAARVLKVSPSRLKRALRGSKGVR